jgi:hypothetical protein
MGIWPCQSIPFSHPELEWQRTKWHLCDRAMSRRSLGERVIHIEVAPIIQSQAAVGVNLGNSVRRRDPSPAPRLADKRAAKMLP